MTNRQFYGLTSLLMLNTAILFKLAKIDPLMWGFGVMAAMMILPVLAYGCARMVVATSIWWRQHKPRHREHHWHDGDSGNPD